MNAAHHTPTAEVQLKRCSHCGQNKPPGEFYRNASMKDGLACQCKACHIQGDNRRAEKQKDARLRRATDPNLRKRCSSCGQEKPGYDFYREPKHTDGLTSLCKFCHKAQSYAAVDGRRKRNNNRLIDPTYTKACAKCGQIKQSLGFHRDHTSEDCLTHECKVCLAEKGKGIRAKNARCRIRDTDIVGHKQCRRCNEIKSVSAFSKSTNYPDYLDALCRPCRRTDRQVRYSTLDGYLRLVWKRVRWRGIHYNMGFDLARDYLRQLWDSQGGRCVYTGIAMTHSPVQAEELRASDGSRFWTNASVDRIDSSKGYIPGNVHLICCWANTAKSDLTDEAFRRFLRIVAEHHTV